MTRRSGWLALSIAAACSSPTARTPTSAPPTVAAPASPVTTAPPAGPRPTAPARTQAPGLPPGAVARLGAGPRHGERIAAVAWFADGKRFATSDGRTTRIWSAAGDLEAELALETSALALSPDGTLVAGGTHTVAVWDVVARKPRWSLELDGDDLVALAFSPDGLDLVIASENHENHHLGPPPSTGLWLRDVETGKPLRTFGVEDGVAAVAYSPDGQRLAYAAERKIQLVERGRTRPFARIAVDATHLAFAPDGKTLFAGAPSQPVRRIDVATRRVRPIKGLASTSFAVSPDGKQLAAIVDDHLSVVELATEREVLKLPGVVDLAYAPTGALTVARGSVPRHLAPGGRDLTAGPGHDRPITSVTCAPDGTSVVTASEDGTARLWDTDGTPRGVIAVGAPVLAATLSRDGARVITASADGALRWWNAATAAPVASVALPATDVVVLADGRVVSATASELQVWTTEGGAPSRRIAMPSGAQARTLAASADGTRLWAGGDGASYLWSTATWATPTKIDGASRAAAFAHDGATIAIDYGIYRTATGARVSFALIGSATRDLAYSSDGRWIAVAFNSDSRIYTASDAKPTRRRFDVGAQGPVTAVTSCGRDTLVAGYQSGDVLVWVIDQIP